MGELARYLTADHRRLEALLDRATAEAQRIDAGLFEQFRSGLLRHIGIEQKILLPAARRARGGAELPVARQLRLDHGAIAAMLVPTPTPAGVTQLRALLALHDALEEGPNGVYDECDELLAGESAALLGQIRAFPTVRTAPHTDGPHVARHIAECLALAGRARS
jgi:hypothetical protein